MHLSRGCEYQSVISNDITVCYSDSNSHMFNCDLFINGNVHDKLEPLDLTEGQAAIFWKQDNFLYSYWSLKDEQWIKNHIETHLNATLLSTLLPSASTMQNETMQNETMQSDKSGQKIALDSCCDSHLNIRNFSNTYKVQIDKGFVQIIRQSPVQKWKKIKVPHEHSDDLKCFEQIEML